LFGQRPADSFPERGAVPAMARIGAIVIALLTVGLWILAGLQRARRRLRARTVGSPAPAPRR
jgi:hypothetical protein